MATVTFYNSFKLEIANGTFDLDNDTFRITLHSSSYTPDIDNDNRFDDIGSELTTAGGYTDDGQLLTSVSLTQDNAGDRALFDFADVEWTADGTGFTARYAVIRADRGGADSADELVCYIDFESDQSPQNTVFRVALNSAGLFEIVQG